MSDGGCAGLSSRDFVASVLLVRDSHLLRFHFLSYISQIFNSKFLR